MRILDKEKIDYKAYEYNCSDGVIDGLSVAKKINQEAKKIFKTLVAQAPKGSIYIFVLPVLKELDLKKAAKAVNEKSIAMLHVKDINKYTGYVRGGCSPIGMKKHYKTVIINFVDSNTNSYTIKEDGTYTFCICNPNTNKEVEYQLVVSINNISSTDREEQQDVQILEEIEFDKFSLKNEVWYGPFDLKQNNTVVYLKDINGYFVIK